MKKIVLLLSSLILYAHAEIMKEKTSDLDRWVRSHAISIIPDEMQTFMPLTQQICKARVVALGENSHFIKEFFQLRYQLIRFMIETCEFNTFAFEFGFAEGEGINRWIHGEGSEDEITKRLSHFYYPKELKATFQWIRAYNKAHGNRVHFLGLDVPGNGGSFFPSLDIIRNSMEKADPDALPLLEQIRTVAKKVDFNSTAQAAFAYRMLSEEEKIRLSASLARTQVRLENLAPRHIKTFGKRGFGTLMRHMDGLVYLDYNIRAMAELIGGKGIQGDTGARDVYMAETLSWYLRTSPEAKVVIVAHNAHIQKVPVIFDGFVNAYTMGQRLEQRLGKEYLALGITSAKGFTAALYPDKNAPLGFMVDNHRLDEAQEGSIENLIVRNGGKDLFLSFMHPPVGCVFPDKIRFDSSYLHEDLRKAFDGIFQTEQSTVSEVVFE